MQSVRNSIVMRRARALPSWLRSQALRRWRAGRSVAEYWSDHNVTSHHKFGSASESLDYIHWRNCQYLYFIENMPVAGFDGKTVLDYGCGPGNDLVGFATQGKPSRLIGMDVAPTSLAEASDRMTLHGIQAELIRISDRDKQLPIDDASVDLVHCSGVLHHTPNPRQILSEFRRVLKPDGIAQIMVYNYDSLWMHLYVAYQRMLLDGMSSGATLREAFRASTDGPDCPISECYKAGEFLDMAKGAGLTGGLRGVSMSAWEMRFLPKRWDALLDRRLPAESRQFLYDLTMNGDGIPCYRDRVAGIGGCYLLNLS